MVRRSIRPYHRRLAIVLAGILFPALGATTAPASRILDLGSLGLYGEYGYGDSEAVAVNDAGQVIGNTEVFGADGPHGFLYDHGRMIDLGTLGGSFSSVVAINESGQVIGVSETGTGQSHAFLYADGVMIDLGTLGGTTSRPTAINDSGQIVGESAIAGDGSSHAFLYDSGVMIDLGTLGGTSSTAVDINSRGQVVGNASTAGDATSWAFLYDGGAMSSLGGLYDDTMSLAVGINDAGDVLGASSGGLPPLGGSYPHWRGFLLRGGAMLALEDLVGGSEAVHYTLPYLLADNGEVAFSAEMYTPYGWGPHEFLFGGSTLLFHSFDEGGSSCFKPREIVGVNDSGIALGNACGAFLYDPRNTGSFVDLVDTFYGQAAGRVVGAGGADLNNLGNVVGQMQISDGGSGTYGHAFLLACPLQPRTDCLEGSRSVLRIRRDDAGTGDSLMWRWAGRDPVTLEDLGTPGSDNPLTLCLYQSVGGKDDLSTSLRIPPGSAWAEGKTGAWRYRSEAWGPSGVERAWLKPGSTAKPARVGILASGHRLQLPPPSDTSITSLEPRVVVQLHSETTPMCWMSEFRTAEVNDRYLFYAKRSGN